MKELDEVTENNKIDLDDIIQHQAVTWDGKLLNLEEKQLIITVLKSITKNNQKEIDQI